MSASAWREDTEEEEEGSDGAGEDEEDADSLATVSGLHPAVSSYMYSVMGSDSDSPDSSTIKCGTWSDSNISAEQRDSSSTDSSPSSGKSHERKVQTAEDTTRCDDFQWIKSETATAAGYESAGRGAAPPSPAPDTDEEECINIVKSKRSDFSGKFCSEKPPVPSGHDRAGPGSLDRRRYHHTSRVDRDQKSKSTHNLKGHQQSPSRQYANGNIYRNTSESPGLAHSYHLDYAGNHVPDSHQADYAHPYHGFTPPRQLGDYQRKAVSYEHFNRRHEHNDPLRYGSNSMLVEGKETYRHEYPPHPYGQYLPPYPPQYACGSRELHGSHGELHWAGPACCHHPAPPWCGCADQARYRPPYGCKNSEAVDDKLRRLESDKDSLQLQVSVLSEQIAAQSEKINDLERLLNEKKNLLTNAEELLQREMLTRSSLETQKLELMSTISDSRLRQAALERENLELRGGLSNGVRGLPNSRTSPSPCPSPAPTTNREGSTPRTPPASYRRLVNPEQSPHSYSSLPRGASLASPGGRPSPLAPMHSTPVDTAVVVRFGKPNQQHCMVVARGRGHSVPNLAEKDTVIGTGSPILGKMGGTGKGWGGLWRGGSGGTLEDVEGMGRGEPFQRGGVRATAAPRLQTTHIDRWSSTPVKEWDADITCEWLESMGLDCYNADAKKWLTNSAGNKGIIATATPQQLEKELNIKNPLHKKKIVLALMDMTVSPVADTLLHAAGRLDCAWALRWLEDLGLPQYREAWASAAADGRVLHLLCQEDLVQLRVTSQMHALSIKRGIQVLRETNFSPDTMIRRAGVPEGATGDSEERPAQLEWGHVSRWSSHRVMEWLRAVDLAEYAPNLRGAGVHGGLMYYEVRFTGELLATLLNIPPSKTLLRRHLNTRFNQLIGKEVIQEKREAEQTLGYQPLTLSSKVKIVKKGQFTLKRKKNKGESEYNDLVCPIVDQASGEILSMTKMEAYGGEGGASRQIDEMSSSTDSPQSQRSDHSRS